MPKIEDNQWAFIIPFGFLVAVLGLGIILKNSVIVGIILPFILIVLVAKYVQT